MSCVSQKHCTQDVTNERYTSSSYVVLSQRLVFVHHTHTHTRLCTSTRKRLSFELNICICVLTKLNLVADEYPHA